MRHGVMMDLPFNPAAYIMQPAYPPKSHAAVLFSSQPPAQAPAPLCISEQQRLLHKRSLRAEAQMRRREKLKQRKMPSPEVVEQPAALQNSSPQPCSAEEQRLLHKRSLRAAAQMRWRERGKARKVLAALSERLVRAMPTKFQFHIQKEWPQPPNAVASFHRRAGYLFYLNRAFQVQWHYELVRQQEKVVDDGIRSVKREGSEEAQNDSSDGRKDLHQSNEDDEEDKKDFVMQDVETPCEDDRSSPALASSSSRVGTPAMASSSSRIISKVLSDACAVRAMSCVSSDSMLLAGHSPRRRIQAHEPQLSPRPLTGTALVDSDTVRRRTSNTTSRN